MTVGLALNLPSQIISDRQLAIEYAVSLALPEDLVIVLGKGHEQGQEIGGVTHHFDDRLVLKAAIEGRL